VIGGPGVAESTHANLPILPISSVVTRYQITLEVVDQPGVLATIATLFSEHGVSVEAVAQTVTPSVSPSTPAAAHGSEAADATATLVIGTHLATEGALADTVAALGASDVVIEVASVLRVEGTE